MGHHSKRHVLSLVGVAVTSLLLATTAEAAAGRITQYPDHVPLAFGMTIGPDGNVWFTGGGDAFPGTIGRVTPAGAVATFTPPGGMDQNITVGSDGNLWFPQHQGRVGRITPAGVITEFQVLPPTGGGPVIRGIATGPDGNLWMTDISDNQVVRMSTSAGNVTTFAVPQYCNVRGCGSYPFGITAGPDGNLWFAERRANRIARITPAGVITEFGGLTSYPDACDFGLNADWPGGPSGITAGWDGNLWFTEVCNARVGRITPQGVVTEYALPHPNTGQCVTGSSSSCSHPFSITAGFDGNVWFVEGDGMRLGRVTPAGRLTEFAIPPAPPQTANPAVPFATGVAPGWDGRVWFGGNTGSVGAATVN